LELHERLQSLANGAFHAFAEWGKQQTGEAPFSFTANAVIETAHGDGTLHQQLKASRFTRSMGRMSPCPGIPGVVVWPSENKSIALHVESFAGSPEMR
jgi:hypothetical protein